MTSRIISTEKARGRGRPKKDTVAQHFTMPRELSDQLDAIRGDAPRPEAIRKLLAVALQNEHWAAKTLHPVVVPLTGLEHASLASWAEGQPDAPTLPEAALRLIQSGLSEGISS